VTYSSVSAFKNPLLIGTCWLIWTSTHFGLLTWWGIGVTTALVDSIVTNLFLLLICLMAANNLRYYRPQKGKYLYIFIFCGVVSVLWCLLIKFSLHGIYHNDEAYIGFLQKTIPLRGSIAFLLTGCMSLIGELWYSLTEQKEYESRKADAEKLAREAELSKLRQQLQPHFLFNSLNSISALVTSQPERARKMIQQLSDFLRGTLRKEENQWTTLGEELQHLQLYLDIEKVRFGHRLNTEVITDEESSSRQLPHMLLQPLVENAIKFGLYDTIAPVTIRINTATENMYLVVSVENPFDPETSSPKKGTGFGLSSVQRRLYLLFARNDLLTTTVDNNLFTTVIKIPQP
jgi:two-component system LytT family sensor kinase